MKQRWAAWAVLAVLSVVIPRISQAQGASPSTPPTSASTAPEAKDLGAQIDLEQNTANPFSIDTKIPFTVGDYPTCSKPKRVYRVFLRVFNILTQLVAIPVLQKGADNIADGAPVQNVELKCGQYTAYWDGKQLKTGADVPQGVYVLRLEVDKQPVSKKLVKQ